MGQFSNPVATHPRTNEVKVPPPGLKDTRETTTGVTTKRVTFHIDIFLLKDIDEENNNG